MFFPVIGKCWEGRGHLSSERSWLCAPLAPAPTRRVPLTNWQVAHRHTNTCRPPPHGRHQARPNRQLPLIAPLSRLQFSWRWSCKWQLARTPGGGSGDRGGAKRHPPSPSVAPPGGGRHATDAAGTAASRKDGAVGLQTPPGGGVISARKRSVQAGRAGRRSALAVLRLRSESAWAAGARRAAAPYVSGSRREITEP